MRGASTIAGAVVFVVFLNISFANAAEPGSREAPIVVQEPDRVVGSPSRAYPDRALRMEVPGKATIVCQVADDGRLADCFVASEAPENYGFGKSTIDLGRSFRMNAATADGVVLRGKWVSLTNTFMLDCPGKANDGLYTLGGRAARAC